MIALYNMYGEEINMYGGHEYVRVPDTWQSW